MFANTIAFLAGVLALQWCPALPPAISYSAVPAALLLLRWPPARGAALLVVGFFWAAFRAELALEPRLDPALEGRTVLVEGRVTDIPRQLSANAIRFPFHIERLDAGQGWRAFGGRVRLSIYEGLITPAAGQHWQFAVRLKRPHGFANPGGFDYERWLFQQRFRATGYVRRDDRNHRIAAGEVSSVAGFRHRLMQAYDLMADGTGSLAMVRALTIGDRGAIAPAQWQVLRATGTSHLMAISGLHISLVAGIAFWLAGFIWARLGCLTEVVPARKAAAVVAVLAALLYALLAGFGIPTRRALVMVSVVMLAIVLDRYSSLPQAICLAVFLTLVADPLAVLAAGWWLSFWAVSVIAWLVNGREGRAGFGQRWITMHLLLAVGMLPLLLVFFQQASICAPLANVVAVPWVSLLVVPLALLGTVVFSVHATAGAAVLKASAWLLDAIWPWLEWLAGFSLSMWTQHQPPAWTLLPAVSGLALLFTPRGLPGRWPGVLLLAPLFLCTPAGPGEGEAWVTLLDVGQGLATVVRTSRHALVYDAGPRFSESFDAGSAVVVPYLRNRGIRRLNTLVVSHGDNDHAGGVAPLLRAYPADRLIAGVPGKLPGSGALSCQAGDEWHWDGVGFSILHPPVGSRLSGNNASCVLRVEVAGGQAVLLSGDIEKSVELGLAGNPPARLAAAVLVAPHHGSLSSSTPVFVRAVHPDVVLFPAGYRNRYGFPRPAVVARYVSIGAAMYTTGQEGAITVKLSPGGAAPGISRYRRAVRHYWQPEPQTVVW
ncbi:MAG: DNA internalization-related competence protein ComEC/Rec2 [Gammaproteobacteria bacterium]|jgi:competence protein ComEC